MSRRRASGGDEEDYCGGEASERAPLSLLDGWCDEDALVALIVGVLVDVGAVVNMLSLYERLQALRLEAGLEPPRHVQRNADVASFRELLEAHTHLFDIRPAPWSTHARLVSIQRGAAPPRSSRVPRDTAAEEAYEAQLVAYLTQWTRATIGTLGLENPPPPGVAARMSTAAFVKGRTPPFAVATAAAGQLSVSLEPALLRVSRSRGSRGGRVEEADESQDWRLVGGERRVAGRARAPAVFAAQAAPTQQPAWSQPAWAPAEASEAPVMRRGGPTRPYAPPSGGERDSAALLPPPGFDVDLSQSRFEAAAPIPLPEPPAPLLGMQSSLLPPLLSILPPPAAASAAHQPGSAVASPAAAPAASPRQPPQSPAAAAEARLLRALRGVTGGERLLALMAASGIEAADLLRLRALPAADADAELTLLGFAEAVQRARVRAALREASAAESS